MMGEKPKTLQEKKPERIQGRDRRVSEQTGKKNATADITVLLTQSP